MAASIPRVIGSFLTTNTLKIAILSPNCLIKANKLSFSIKKNNLSRHLHHLLAVNLFSHDLGLFFNLLDEIHLEKNVFSKPNTRYFFFLAYSGLYINVKIDYLDKIVSQNHFIKEKELISTLKAIKIIYFYA